MEKRIYDLPDAPLPLNPNSYYEVLVPDGSSATGYTSCKIKPSNILHYKVYTAIINQSGTSAPTSTVLHNTLSGNVVFSRNTDGQYLGTLSGAFTSGKTFFYAYNYVSGTYTELYYNDVNSFTLNSKDGTFTFDDDLLQDLQIEIRVYP